MVRVQSSLKVRISAGALTAQWVGSLDLHGVAGGGRLRSRQAVALSPAAVPGPMLVEAERRQLMEDELDA